MNSNSKYPLHKENSDGRKDHDGICKHHKANRVVLESEYGNLGPLDVTFTEGLTIQAINRPVASVTIDTTCFKCADVLVDFTGILNVTPEVSATSILTFTLFKVCKGFRARQSAATFNFFVADIFSALTASHTLVFKFPFKNDDCNCCTYVLELTSISNLDLGTVTYSINGTMSALAVECSC